MEQENKKLEELKNKFSHIKGWAVDADPENEPTYPMKNWTGADHERLDWDRPPLQEKKDKILQSTEHLRTPAVFGTVHPPKGVSGAIRKQAFGYSENMLRHWLMLIFADRVDVVEGVLEDFAHGRVPQWWTERGFAAMWEHDKKLLAKRAAIRTLFYGAAIGLVAYMLLDSDEEKVTKKKSRLA